MSHDQRAMIRKPVAACPAPRRRGAGFSLLELVTVMAIVTVVAAIAMPRYSTSLARYRAAAAARRVAGDLELARGRAAAASATTVVQLNMAADTYAIAGISDMDSAAANTTVNLADAPYHAKLNSAFGLTDANTSTTLSFNGYGQPDKGGDIVIESSGITRTIKVDAQTGEATTP